MKRFCFIFLYLFVFNVSNGQITIPTNYPTLQSFHILDNNLDDISFAFSFRVLVSDYNGPLVRLRRDSDNAEEDFCANNNDIVDTDAVNAWKGTANVYIVRWYDQSGLGRNAVQPLPNRQPLFTSNPTRPFFGGDGIDDYLLIDTPNGIQDVTDNGDEGTVLAVMQAQRRNHSSFGVLTASGRWLAHTNWGDNFLYFDPGGCCNTPRRFENGASVGNWRHYTMVKTPTNSIARLQGVEQFNGVYISGQCTSTKDFTIGCVNGNQTAEYSTTGFIEFILYATDINNSVYAEIEQNSIVFWGI